MGIVVECKELNGTVIGSKGVIMAIVFGSREFMGTVIGLKNVIVGSKELTIESNDVIIGMSRSVSCGGVVSVSQVVLHPATIAMSTITARHPRVSNLKCISHVRVACIHCR
jgi:hypothetical protein